MKKREREKESEQERETEKKKDQLIEVDGFSCCFVFRIDSQGRLLFRFLLGGGSVGVLEAGYGPSSAIAFSAIILISSPAN